MKQTFSVSKTHFSLTCLKNVSDKYHSSAVPNIFQLEIIREFELCVSMLLDILSRFPENSISIINAFYLSLRRNLYGLGSMCSRPLM